MPKKRKSRSGASGSANEANGATNAFEDRKGSRIKLGSWQDAMDSEDEFLEEREKILLDEGLSRKRARRLMEEEVALEASDEEVLGVEDDDSVEEGDEEFAEEYDGEDGAEEEEYDEDVEITGKSRKSRGDEEDEESGWGTSRKDLYGEDEMETEEAALAQEKEARRIQQKQLEAMEDDDFGLGDAQWAAAGDVVADREAAVADERFLERLPEASLADNATTHDRARLLKERYPEFEPLKNEFLELQTTFVELRQALMDNESTVIAVQYLALAAYLGILSMYFALLTSTATKDGKAFAKAPVQLRDHEIMQGLVQARSTWVAAQDLEELESSDEDSESGVEQVLVAPETSRLSKKSKKAKPLSASELAQAASVARRAARVAAAEAEFADLGLQAVQPTSYTKSDGSELYDDSRLQAYEAAAKAAKKKSLRYYTSEITQKANKRQARGNEVGGDADIPHREKWYDRQLRLQAEAQQRKEQVMDQRYGENAGSRNGKDARPDDDEHDNEYQSLMSRAQKVKSAKKNAAAEDYALQAAARDAGFLAAQTEIGPDGKRKITYQIEKNKGLAPHRKKDVRNPRVKKRNKYEEKKKKLGSMKAVYKGGPGKGGYQGELTGIKTGLVKGIKLS